MKCGHLAQQQLVTCATCSHGHVTAAHSFTGRRSPPPATAQLLRTAGCAPLAAYGSLVASDSGRTSSPPRQRNVQTLAESGSGGSKSEGPQLAADAISAGLKQYHAGDPEAALDLFQKALELPGTGLKRFRDKPREASAEEKQAALYNTACCLGRMGDSQKGLYAIAGCLEAGYTDYGQLRRDPDLEPLRENPKFEGLLKRFEPGGGFLSPLLRGFGGE